MMLEYAILGFLSYRPFSGYELKKIFDASVRHFWPADQAQIYRTLKRLAEQGLLDQELVEQDARPDRKVYHITSAGREVLRGWLLSPVSHGENRSAPLVQVFFAGQLSDDEILAIFEHNADLIRQGLSRLQQIPQALDAFSEYVQSPREFTFWMMTREIGIFTAQANLEFIENVMQRIRAGGLPPE